MRFARSSGWVAALFVIDGWMASGLAAQPSEAEPLRTAPAPGPSHSTPQVAGSSSNAGTRTDVGLRAARMAGPFRALSDFCAEYSESDDSDFAGPALCRIDKPALAGGVSKLAVPVSPWLAAVVFGAARDSSYSDLECNLAIQTPAGWFVAAALMPCGVNPGAGVVGELTVDGLEIAVRELRSGAPTELVFRYVSTLYEWVGGERIPVEKAPAIVSCALDARRLVPTCARPVVLGESNPASGAFDVRYPAEGGIEVTETRADGSSGPPRRIPVWDGR